MNRKILLLYFFSSGLKYFQRFDWWSWKTNRSRHDLIISEVKFVVFSTCIGTIGKHWECIIRKRNLRWRKFLIMGTFQEKNSGIDLKKILHTSTQFDVCVKETGGVDLILMIRINVIILLRRCLISFFLLIW